MPNVWTDYVHRLTDSGLVQSIPWPRHKTICTLRMREWEYFAASLSVLPATLCLSMAH